MDDNWKRYSRLIAERAAETMREKNITQRVLAERLGRTQQYVSHILSGKENLTIETIALLSDALESKLMRDLLLGTTGYSGQAGLLRDSQTDIMYGPVRSSLPILVSSSPIIKRFNSGDRPFLINCNNSKKYLCKAASFNCGATNLARELIGSSFANLWGLADMEMAIVKVYPEHLDGSELQYNYAVSCLGREWVDESVEIKDNHLRHIEFSEDTLFQLLKIALFDIWLSNEDRLNNNLNLLYSKGNIIAIDHAGVFNSSFSSPLLQLSLTDSVIYSNLFSESVRNCASVFDRLNEIELFFNETLSKCQAAVPAIRTSIANDWKIDGDKFDRIMEYIFSPKWKKACISNLISFLSTPQK